MEAGEGGSSAGLWRGCRGGSGRRAMGAVCWLAGLVQYGGVLVG